MKFASGICCKYKETKEVIIIEHKASTCLPNTWLTMKSPTSKLGESLITKVYQPI